MTNVNIDDAVLAEARTAKRALTGKTESDAEVLEAALELATLMWTNEAARKTETERHEQFVAGYKQGKAGQRIVRPAAPEAKDPPPEEEPEGR